MAGEMQGEKESAEIRRGKKSDVREGRGGEQQDISYCRDWRKKERRASPVHSLIQPAVWSHITVKYESLKRLKWSSHPFKGLDGRLKMNWNLHIASTWVSLCPPRPCLLLFASCVHFRSSFSLAHPRISPIIWSAIECECGKGEKGGAIWLQIEFRAPPCAPHASWRKRRRGNDRNHGTPEG